MGNECSLDGLGSQALRLGRIWEVDPWENPSGKVPNLTYPKGKGLKGIVVTFYIYILYFSFPIQNNYNLYIQWNGHISLQMTRIFKGGGHAFIFEGIFLRFCKKVISVINSKNAFSV